MDGRPIDELLRSLGSPEPQHAWAEFLEAYAPVILQAVKLREQDCDSVSDCFLFVCEALARDRFRRLRKFRSAGPASFQTWLRAVVRNLCIDWHRAKFGRPREFEFINSLSAFDHEVFRCIHTENRSLEETFLELSPRFPSASRDDVARSADRISQSLSQRNRWLLQARQRVEAEDPSHALDAARDSAPSPESAAVTQQLHSKMRRAVEKLTARERLLLQLRFEQEMTLQQIARVLEMGDAQRADRLIREILGKLRDALDPPHAATAEKLKFRP